MLKYIWILSLAESLALVSVLDTNSSGIWDQSSTNEDRHFIEQQCCLKCKRKKWWWWWCSSHFTKQPGSLTPFPCIIAVSVKANLESLMTVRTAHSPLHSSDSSLGVTTNFFLPNFHHPDPSVTVLLQEKRWKMSFPKMATWWFRHFMKMSSRFVSH